MNRKTYITVLDINPEVSKVKKRTHYNVRCICGKEYTIREETILKNTFISCGCIGFKDNISKNPLYKIYNHMINRCYNIENKRYKDYGGRGIKVCDKWLGEKGFETFLNDMNNRPSLDYTLDRIDNEKGYSKENCKWSTASEQSNNRRTTIKITVNNDTKSIMNWSIHLDIEYEKFRRKLFKMSTSEKELYIFNLLTDLNKREVVEDVVIKEKYQSLFIPNNLDFGSLNDSIIVDPINTTTESSIEFGGGDFDGGGAEGSWENFS